MIRRLGVALSLVLVAAGVGLVVDGSHTTTMWLIHGQAYPIHSLGDAGVGSRSIPTTEVGRNWLEIGLGLVVSLAATALGFLPAHQRLGPFRGHLEQDLIG